MSSGTCSGTSSVVEIRKEDLKVIKKIGEGGFSCVYHVIWTKNKTSGETVHVAAKVLHEIEKHELEVLSQLSHPNIIKLVGVVSDVFTYMLILELCENGSLRAYIDEHGKKPLPPDLFDTWSKQAAQAIEYLQKHGIIHKDIKSQNYVISSDMILKLTDFGLSKKADFTFSCATQRGTYGYMAPELLKDFKLSPMKYDIFSLGVVIWEMITGKIPYEGMEYVAIVMHVCKANKRPEIPSDCPEYIAKLLNGCWLADHKLRPDIHQVLAILDAEECKSTNNWTFQSQFGHQEDPVDPKLQKASAIAVSKDGDVAVFDFATDSTHVYTNEGQFNLTFGASGRQGIKGQANRPFIPRPLVAGPKGNYFLGNDSQHVEMYGSNGILKETITLLPPQSSAKLGGLAFDPALDTNGHLLVGVYDYQEIEVSGQRSASVSSMDDYVMDSEVRLANFILVLKKFNDVEADLEGIVKIPVSIQPGFLAVTPLDTIVVASLPRLLSSSLRNSWLQIIDKRGEVLRNLIDPPPGVTRLRVTGVCCRLDTIFITNDYRDAPNEYGVYCYSLSGEYMGCATKEVLNPVGIAISEDGEKMYVAQYEKGNVEEGKGKHGVKVFRRV